MTTPAPSPGMPPGEDRLRAARKGAAHGVWLAIVLAIVVVVNLISGVIFVRFDLTHDRRYTLADVSREAVGQLEGSLRAFVFLSGELPAPYNRLDREVRDLLTEYRAHSGGRMHFTFVDPALDEDDAERARNLGILPVTIGEQSRDALSFREVYMGISLVYAGPDGDREAVIEQLFPGMNLEYEITRRLRDLQREEEPPVVAFLVGDGSFFDGLIEHLSTQQNPMFGPADPAEVRERLAGQLADQLFDGLFRVAFVDASQPLDDIDALLVLGPRRALSDETLRNIDAFVQRGGGAGFFVSPWRMGASPFGVDMPGMDHFAQPEPNATGLQPLLEAWGVRLNEDTLIDREVSQISVEIRTIGFMGDQPLQSPLPVMDPRLPLFTDLNPASLLATHVPLLAFQPANRRQPLPVSSLALTSSARERMAEERLEVVEVVRANPTTTRRRHAPSLSLEQALQPSAQEETGGGWPVIVTLEGHLPSAFDDAGSTDAGRLLVAANGDFITNVFSGQDPLRDPNVLRTLPPQVIQTVQQYSASSVLFLRNATDWLVADADLIRIRARGTPVFLEAESLQRERRTRVQALNIVGVPLLFIALGVTVFFARQRRRRALSAAFEDRASAREVAP